MRKLFGLYELDTVRAVNRLLRDYKLRLKTKTRRADDQIEIWVEGNDHEENEEKLGFGNIYGTDTVFMTIDVPLWNQDRRNYKITANMENGAALVYSMKTGKWFEIPPDQLVELAVKAGVDE